jgi:hypothetical protein
MTALLSSPKSTYALSVLVSRSVTVYTSIGENSHHLSIVIISYSAPPYSVIALSLFDTEHTREDALTLYSKGAQANYEPRSTSTGDMLVVTLRIVVRFRSSTAYLEILQLELCK